MNVEKMFYNLKAKFQDVLLHSMLGALHPCLGRSQLLERTLLGNVSGEEGDEGREGEADEDEADESGRAERGREGGGLQGLQGLSLSLSLSSRNQLSLCETGGRCKLLSWEEGKRGIDGDETSSLAQAETLAVQRLRVI